MTWAKLSDGFNDDPALMMMPRGHRLLYVELLVWSCKQGTDGFVPAPAIHRVSDEPNPLAAVQSLIDQGLLEPVDNGWQMTRFAEEQMSAEEVSHRRELTRKRQERRRRHLNGDHSTCDPAYCQQASRVTNASNTRESRHPVLPDMPVPPDPSGSGRGQAESEGGNPSPGSAATGSAGERKRCPHGLPVAADGSACLDCLNDELAAAIPLRVVAGGES